MRIEDYPPQEPLSEAGRTYHQECLRLGAGVPAGEEALYGDDPYQGLIVWRAPKPSGAMLAFMHGGGWTGGYKEWMAFMAPAFTEAGIDFASVGYRLAPQHVFPTALEDALKGVEWLRSHGAGRLFVGGHSAGGHYAALLALTMPPGTIAGCLPLSGVFEFGPQSGLSQRPRFLGPVEAKAEEPASPLFRIAGTPPPFLIAHGSADFPHLIPQAERMEAALRKAGGEVERIVLEGRNHFTASYAGGEKDGPWVPAAIRFIRTHNDKGGKQ
jgi:arylformamidase